MTRTNISEDIARILDIISYDFRKEGMDENLFNQILEDIQEYLENDYKEENWEDVEDELFEEAVDYFQWEMEMYRDDLY